MVICAKTISFKLDCILCGALIGLNRSGFVPVAPSHHEGGAGNLTAVVSFKFPVSRKSRSAGTATTKLFPKLLLQRPAGNWQPATGNSKSLSASRTGSACEIPFVRTSCVPYREHRGRGILQLS